MYYRFVLNGQEEHPTLLSNSVLTNAHCTVNIKVLGNTGTYIVPWVSVIVGTNTNISDSGQGNHIMQCFSTLYIYIYICLYQLFYARQCLSFFQSVIYLCTVMLQSL